jgi:hypothetical protein
LYLHQQCMCSPFLHILASILSLLFFIIAILTGQNGTFLWVWFVSPWWLVMLNSLHLSFFFLRTIYSNYLPIFKLDYMCFVFLLLTSLYVLDTFSCWVNSSQILSVIQQAISLLSCSFSLQCRSFLVPCYPTCLILLLSPGPKTICWWGSSFPLSDFGTPLKILKTCKCEFKSSFESWVMI